MAPLESNWDFSFSIWKQKQQKQHYCKVKLFIIILLLNCQIRLGRTHAHTTSLIHYLHPFQFTLSPSALVLYNPLPVGQTLIIRGLPVLHAGVSLLQLGLSLFDLLLKAQSGGLNMQRSEQESINTSCTHLLHGEFRHQCHHFPGDSFDLGLVIVDLLCHSQCGSSLTLNLLVGPVGKLPNLLIQKLLLKKLLLTLSKPTLFNIWIAAIVIKLKTYLLYIYLNFVHLICEVIVGGVFPR